MSLNPISLPFATANAGATLLSEDVSGGAGGGYPGTVSVLLSNALTLLPRQPGQVGVPGLVGAASPGEYAGLVLASGSTVEFTLPQAAAIVAAGLGEILSYN